MKKYIYLSILTCILTVFGCEMILMPRYMVHFLQQIFLSPKQTMKAT